MRNVGQDHDRRVGAEIIDADGDAACFELTEDDCATQGGNYLSDNTTCDDVSDPCPQPATGDMNQDGVVDGFDIRGFTNVCADPSNAGLPEKVLADLNGDGRWTRKKWMSSCRCPW